MKSIRAYQLRKLGHTRNKFNAVKTKLDGYTFDSKREAAVYAQLKLLSDAGKISDLKVHPCLSLTVRLDYGLGYSIPTDIGHYEADFSFVENGERKFVDVKGVDTPLSKWKRRHVFAQYRIEVEVWR